MKKIVKIGMVLLVLIFNLQRLEASSDIVFVDRMMTSSVVVKRLNLSLPKWSDWTFRDTDKIIFYYANIGVINPSKKSYNIEIVCTDIKGNPIIKSSLKKDFSEFSEYNIGKDKVRNGIITLILDPKPGGMVKGQLLPLENGKDYFIKIYFEKQLIGVTQFDYITAVTRTEYEDIEMKKTIETAQQMLEEGSDPYFVSKFTGISIENVKLLQK
jgi:hypothetical protein